MAQDWSVHALVYFYSAGSDLPWAVLNWRLDLELTDMKVTKDYTRMAREANVYCTTRQPTLDAMLERFAALVAAAEREACAKVCESYLSESPHSWGGTTMAAAIRARGNT
jgi:hypothetical protein